MKIRFETKVNYSHPRAWDTGCWLWTGSTDGHGYGQIYDATVRKPVKAHRVAWQLFYGTIPAGRAVLHSCDTPLCVNHMHLFLGSQKDNMDDAYIKGRHVAHVHAAKTHCPQGHEYTESNTRVYRGRRWCRKCDSLRGNRGNK